jgi:hypothetical protein
MSVVPSTSTAVHGSCALEHRRKRRESCPPDHPASRANSERPILITKCSVVPVLVSIVDDRLMERPLVPFPHSERPYKFTLASTGVPAHNQKGGDSIGEVRIVRRRAAVRDGSAGSRRR